jgi:phosphohistidine phosphatase
MAAAGRIKPNKIYHSGKTRARQTAELIAQQLDLLDNLEQADGLAPMDDPSIWAENIVKTTKDVILVGHLPHLQKLAALLLFQDENKTTIKFQNSGILCLERDDSSAWSLEWMVVPQVLP